MSGRPIAAGLAVLVSGRGSNLQAIFAQIDNGTLPMEIRVVASDRGDAPALDWATRQGLNCEVLLPTDYPDRESYDRALALRLDRYRPDLVALAGFMRILSAPFVDLYEGRMLNIHPSLLPRHRGLHTHRRVLEAGEREHGASVHFVTRELDGGPVVLQARVPVHDDDNAQTLAARVLEQEHRIYPRCIGWFATGRLRYSAGAAWLDGNRLESPIILDANNEIAA
jgi:phosphoribosylglycinamide formyltransferase-1